MRHGAALSTASDVIDALGGPTVMTRIFGGGPSRFCNYRAKGAFPEGIHFRLYVECRKRGLNIAPELVGVTADDLAIAMGDRQRCLPILAK